MIRNRDYINCDCGTHAISIESDEDIKDLTIAFWNMGHTNIRSFRERIRYIWHILKTGEPWSDMICLNRAEMLQLRKILSKHIKNVE